MIETFPMLEAHVEVLATLEPLDDNAETGAR